MNSKTARRVAVIEDCPELLFVLGMRLRRLPGVRFIGGFATVEDCLMEVKEDPPDVVVLDFHLPSVTGVEAINRLQKHIPISRILVMSEDERPNTILDAISAGVAGYWLKSSVFASMAEAIESVSNGGISFGPHAQKIVSNAFIVRARLVAKLSPTERLIEQKLSAGVPYKDLAESLRISPSTLRTHARNILAKSHANNTREAHLNQMSGL